MKPLQGTDLQNRQPVSQPPPSFTPTRFSTIDSSSAVDTSHFEWGCVKGDARNAGRYDTWLVLFCVGLSFIVSPVRHSCIVRMTLLFCNAVWLGLELLCVSNLPPSVNRLGEHATHGFCHIQAAQSCLQSAASETSHLRAAVGGRCLPLGDGAMDSKTQRLTSVKQRTRTHLRHPPAAQPCTSKASKSHAIRLSNLQTQALMTRAHPQTPNSVQPLLPKALWRGDYRSPAIFC